MWSRNATATTRRRAWILVLLCTATAASASLGPYEQGNGIKAMGAGGVSYVAAEETTALSANPAHADSLGARYDIGIDVLSFYPQGDIEGNPVAPDSRHPSDGRRYYPLPQGGANFTLSPKWSAGLSMLLAGVGPDYPRSPYERFGGAPRASLALGSASIASALAYRFNERHNLGVGVIGGYQTLRVEGLQFLASSEPQFQVSQRPEDTTNQGKDGSLSIAWSAGWSGRLSEQTHAGMGYRSKSWTQKHHEYRGLLPDGGSLELPAVYGAAIAHDPVPQLRVALEWQRYEYEGERAFGNRLSNLSSGNLLGSPNGPGFGLRNQQAWKLGLTWDARPDLRLRGGYVRANQAIRESDSLFPMLAPVAMTTHYTAGGTYVVGSWEWSGYASYQPRKSIGADGSIPAAFGGGTATVSNEGFGLGFSIGHRLGTAATTPTSSREKE